MNKSNLDAIHTCELCQELAGRTSRFQRIYQGLSSNRLIARTQNFAVLPSIGQLGSAHLLIVSRSHFTATTQLDELHKEELQAVMESACIWMRQHFADNVVAFENGDPNGDGQMACSVSHLHVHLVASNSSMSGLYPAIRSLGAVEIESMTKLPAIGGAYSCMQAEGCGALLVPRRLPSQTLRRLIASELDLAHWDWRAAAQEEQLVRILTAASVESRANEIRAA